MSIGYKTLGACYRGLPHVWSSGNMLPMLGSSCVACGAKVTAVKGRRVQLLYPI